MVTGMIKKGALCFSSGPKVYVTKVWRLDGVQRLKHDIEKELGAQFGSRNTKKAIKNLYRIRLKRGRNPKKPLTEG